MLATVGTSAARTVDPQAIADLFTDDGVWAVTVRDPQPTGRAEIVEMAKKLQNRHCIVHFALNPLIHVGGDEATGQFKGTVRVRLAPEAEPQLRIGRYDLFARRTPTGWRIHALEWQSMSEELSLNA